MTCPVANFAKSSCFCLFVEILSPLGDLWRSPLEPPPTPSWPFAVLRGPSWKCFCLFALRGYPLPPSQPLANPSRSPTNPLVALCRSSWPFVDFFLPFRVLRGPLRRPSWITLFPLVSFVGPPPDPWQTPLEPPPTPSWPFAVLRGPSWKCFCLFALRGYPLPPSQPLANPSRSPTNPLVALRGPSYPFVDNSFSLRALRGSPSWISFLEDASHRRALLARPKGLAYYFCRGRETQ